MKPNGQALSGHHKLVYAVALRDPEEALNATRALLDAGADINAQSYSKGYYYEIGRLWPRDTKLSLWSPRATGKLRNLLCL